MSSVDLRTVLAANLLAMIEHDSPKGERLSVRAWANQKDLNVRMIDRLTKGQHAVTLDKLEAIAKACNLQPWQLLVPDLNPATPPGAAFSSEDRAMLDRLKTLLSRP